jgi:serine/threonine-protein kinase
MLDAIILKLLAKKREDRYRDTAELRQDLERVMRGEAPASPGAVAPPQATAMSRGGQQQPQRLVPATDRVEAMAPPRVGKGTIFVVAGLVLVVAAVVAGILLFVVH